MFSLQRLNAGLLVGAHQMNPLSLQFRRFFVKFTDRCDLVVKLLWVVRAAIIQPVARQMRLKIGLALKSAPHCVGKSGSQCPV